MEKDTKFIINDVNLYDIDDVDMYCMEGLERDFDRFLNSQNVDSDFTTKLLSDYKEKMKLALVS